MAVVVVAFRLAPSSIATFCSSMFCAGSIVGNFCCFVRPLSWLFFVFSTFFNFCRQFAMSGAATSAAKGLVKRGAFILFEGCDRSGKSTQVAKLVQRLQADGSKVEAMRFPDRTTEIGKMIDAYLRCATHLDDRAVHLLFSANRWECRERILALLEQGTSIVCDRYTFSGVAFSASKVGMDVEWCKAPDEGRFIVSALIGSEHWSNAMTHHVGVVVCLFVCCCCCC